MHGCRALVLVLFLVAVPAHAEPVLACADQAEMPPFTYAERVNGRKTENVTGASVDLLRLIGRPHGWQVSVQLLPWTRCLALVADNTIQFAMNVGKAEADASNLLLSRPYFSMHNVYFYSRRTRPEGLALHSLADLRHYHLCGLYGYRFEPFGINTNDVDRGSTVSYEQLIAKLHLGRCDLFIDSRETMAGMYLVNPKLRAMLVDGTLVSQPLPGSPQRELYIAVSAKATNSAATLNALNEGLDRLSKTKEFDKLLSRYFD